MSTRDHMRNRVYKAEKKFVENHPEAKGDKEELEQFADKVCKKRYFRNSLAESSSDSVRQSLATRPAFPIIEVVTTAQCLPSHLGDVNDFTIQVSTFSNSYNQNTRLSVLHSLAHLILGHHQYYGDLHDGAFVSQYLNLVERFYNGKADSTVRKEFKEYLLEFGAKTRAVSDEQREAARDRWYKQQVPDTRKDILSMLEELEGLGGSDDDV